MLPARFVLMRHGDTSWDSSDPKLNRINGWSSEGLDSRGQAQVAASIPTLAEAGLTGILTSDLERAEETARLVGEALGLQAVSEYGLRCWFVGMYAGQREVVVDPLIQFFINHPLEPIPCGESWQTATNRFMHTLGVVEDYALRHPDKCLLVVTHGSPIQMYRDSLLGYEPGSRELSGFPPAGLLNVMYLNGTWHAKETK